MGRMDTKAKYAGVPPRQPVWSTSILLWPGAGLQLSGFSIELGYKPCRDLWWMGSGEKG